MDALGYELFVRNAFSYKTGRTVERWGDPAGIANTDVFTEGNLPSVKAGVAYSMEILSNDVEDVEDDERRRIDKFTARVINASSIREIAQLITEYNETVRDKYYAVDDGTWSLKRR